MARLTDEQVGAIKAALERDPYANIPDSAFRQAGAFRPKPDDVPVELNRAEVRALLADLEEAREHRRILREALEQIQCITHYDKVIDWAKEALAATEQEEKP